MRAGSVTFLLFLAFIDGCWAGNSTSEEEPPAMEDKVLFKYGSAFIGDKVFAEQANSILKYSAEVMKESTTIDGTYYAYHKRVGNDVICLDVDLLNKTSLGLRINVTESEKLKTNHSAGYIFDEDETFANKADLLLKYSLDVMKECTTKECHHYIHCIKVGNNLMCLSVYLIPENRPVTFLKKPVNLDEDAWHFKQGYTFDGDEIFEEKGESLLQYSAPILKKCITNSCRSYVICDKMDDDYVCVSVWLSKGNIELMQELQIDQTYDDDEVMDDKDYVYEEPEDDDVLLEEMDVNNEVNTPDIKEEEEKQQEIESEDNVEEAPLA